MGFTIELKNAEEFRAALTRASAKVADLTIPLQLIAQDWFDSNAAIFSLKGPGQYPDLSPTYKKAKQRQWGFIYPILKASGRLENSITDPGSPDSINEIRNKNTLIIGTAVPYGVYHQSDGPRKKLPLRKFLFIGPESQFTNKGRIAGRLERWTSILNDYVIQKMDQEGFRKK